MNEKEKILELIASEKIKYDSSQRLCEIIAAKINSDKKTVTKIFNELLADGIIVENGKKKFVSCQKYNIKKCKLIGNAKGFAFCQVLGLGANKKDDLFIPPNKLCGAMDGDIVLVNPVKGQLGKTEGEVIKILKITFDKIVGTIKIEKTGYGIVQSDNKKFSKPVYIRKTKLGEAVEGNKVVVKITKHPVGIKFEKIEGEVVEVLGNEGEKGVLELSIIRAHNLYEEFTEQVIEASKLIPQEVNPNLFKNRLDLTKETIFTIDGANAKDFDDAVSIEVLSNGNYKLGVHIADVGEYVKQGSPIDEEAYLRGTSSYFPDLVLPMLPVSLSNGICSLNPNVLRLTLSVFMEINDKGDVVDYSMYESIIKSCARLTYKEVADVLDGDEETTKKYISLAPIFFKMNELAKILQKKRTLDGALDFDLPETYIQVDENGETVAIKKRERTDAHKFIESFMIICNEIVAKHFNQKQIPFMYRVHEVPTREKVENLLEFASSLGLHVDPLPIEITPKYIQSIITACENKPYTDTMNKVMLRSMQKAKYYEKCLGHFGLALKNYCHFTSPIRRYPDLCIHRILKAELNKKITSARAKEILEFVIDAAFRSSEREKNAEEAEREVDDLKKAQFMAKKLGEEFDGKICGVTNFGLFVELENTIEGFVKIESLQGMEYIFDEKHYILKNNANTYRLGDNVRIKVVASNPYTRKIDFELIKRL